MSKKKYYSIREIAEYFDVSDTTIRKQIKSGKIKSIKVGAMYRVSRKELEKLFADLVKPKQDVLA